MKLFHSSVSFALLTLMTILACACSLDQQDGAPPPPPPPLVCNRLADQSPATLSSQPYVGVNFTHYGNQLEGYSIIQNYHDASVCLQVQSHLTAMRSNGAQTVRILIWHYDAATAQDWGVIPHRLSSGNIGIPEPYRSNLINYLQDIKSAGFARAIIGFAPMADNNPFQDWQNCQADFFDAGNPDYFDQNWNFIQVVRDLAVTHGPSEIRFDLLNEGVPNVWLDSSCTGGKSTRQQVKTYGTNMLNNFATAFGAGAATISAITSARVLCTSATTYDTAVLEGSLQDLLDMHGAHTPDWFALHMYDADDASCTTTQELEVIHQSLLAADSFFTGQGYPSTPFVIQETYYNNSEVAAKIDQFIQTSSRGVEEILSWPHTQGSASHVNIAPPYQVDEYTSLQ